MHWFRRDSTREGLWTQIGPPSLQRLRVRWSMRKTVRRSRSWTTGSKFPQRRPLLYVVLPDRCVSLTSCSGMLHHPSHSPLSSHSRPMIRITELWRVIRNNGYRLLTLTTIAALPPLPTDLRIFSGAMMDTNTNLNHSSPTVIRKGFVVPATPGGAVRKAKATFPDSHVVPPGREIPTSHHRHPPPYIAAHCIIISEAGRPIRIPLLTAVQYPESHPPQDPPRPRKVQVTFPGNRPKRLLYTLTSAGVARRSLHPSRRPQERASRLVGRQSRGCI